VRLRLKFIAACVAFVALAGLPVVSAQSAAQDADDTPLELSANLVTITVVVRDASGSLVTDLGPADFTVFEENKRQEIDQVLREGEVPLRLAFLFDASKSVRDRLDYSKRAASGFFTAAIKPGDQFSLYSVATDVRVEQPLTGSVGTLVDKLARIDAEGMTAFHDSIRQASGDLRSVDGRRVILALTDGYDTNSKASFAAALEAAQRADVVVYAISPAGAGDALNSHAKLGLENLRRLCTDTGGVAFFPPIEFKRWQEEQTLNIIYKRITEELRAQMVITYYSTSDPQADGFHDLRVQVNRPGLTVSARKGFYDKRPGA
jgi:Ca-activated chloride channel homolog